MQYKQEVKLAIPVHLDKDWSIYFDYTDQGIFCHIDFHRWSKEVLKKVMPVIDKLAGRQTLPVYVEVYDREDIKYKKFITRVGFVRSQYITEEGNDVYIWRKL
jgi:hypothetical protein